MRKVLLAARGLRWGDGVEVDLTVCEGDLVAILADPGTDQAALLRILGFREPPAVGDLFWEGRLIDRRCEPQRVGFFPADAEVMPRLLLADEPGTAAMRLLLALHERTGQTILLATRDPEVAVQCPTVYRLSAGGLRRLVPEVS